MDEQCAICAGPDPEMMNKRLCWDCWKGLEAFGHSPKLLRKARKFAEANQ